MTTEHDFSLHIGDLIEVPPVQTVIRLDEALQKSNRVTESFVFTADVSNHIAVLANAMQQENGRGCFIQGDFGSGKSHFLAALGAWLAGDAGTERLTADHEGLRTLQESGRRFLPVAISLVNYRSSTPLERIISTAIENSLAGHGVQVSLSPLTIFLNHFKKLLEEPALAAEFDSFRGSTGTIDTWFASDNRQAYIQAVGFLKRQGIDIPELLVEEKYEIFSEAVSAVQDAGFHGLVLLIDELSEFFRSKTSSSLLNEDARTLQFLGELSGSSPLWIIAAVQESVERTGDIAQATFRKIKDRFPIRFYLSTLHIRDLIAKRLIKHKEGADEHLYHIHENYRNYFPSFTCAWDIFRTIYPIHPTTLSLLEGLGELFSQHRGIVDFVHARCAGDPARGIQGILDHPCTELLAPDSIYEHFTTRLSEFSAFHIYPRQIVPHLDEVIEKVLDKEDHELARKLIRILVLYTIHPTAKRPDVRTLAELSSCLLASHDPDVNVQFIADAVLDPIVEHSRFLVKEPCTADYTRTVYTIITQEDHGKTLKAKIARATGEILPKDQRLVLEPLSRLEASISWPGPEVLQHPVERTVTWRQSPRAAVVVFIQQGMEKVLADRIGSMIESGKVDFALVISVGATSFSCAHTAVWQIPFSGGDHDVLREFLALTMLAGELSRSNPADAPLIPLINERITWSEQAAAQEILARIYTGSFSNPAIHIDSPALQIKRFDRLLEAAGDYVLEERYPKFKQIASTHLLPSPRLYHDLFEHFIVPGSVTLGEARNMGLSQAIDSIAAPLGLVEVKSGSYRVSPNPADHAFLSYVFGLFHASETTPIEQVLHLMRTGPYGVPADTAEFLLASLAHSGLISLLRQGRSVPLDFLKLNSVANADAVAPGELISQNDRETLQTECAFLFPAGKGPGPFGLKQQRELWQTVVKLKKSLQTLLHELNSTLVSVSEYSAFASFDLDAIREKCADIQNIIDEIKVSYTARDGLERFCRTWRQLDITAEDMGFIKKCRRFFLEHAEYFIFIVHYLRHQSVENAVRCDTGVEECYNEVTRFIQDPMCMVIIDEGQGLDQAFAVFRKTYAACYSGFHERFYKTVEKPALSKYAQRVLFILRNLAGVSVLDRPPGLEQLLQEFDKPPMPVCRRSVHEELLRSPVCGCTIKVGDELPAPVAEEPEKTIETCLEQYVRILGSPEVLEPLGARIYALGDINPAVSKRLDRLCILLKKKKAVEPTLLLDLLDAEIIGEIGVAVSGRTVITPRPLDSLTATLAGRRLTPDKIRRIVDEWLATADREAIISIEGSAPAVPGKKIGLPQWWLFLRPDIFPVQQNALSEAELESIAQSVEELFPAGDLNKILSGFDTGQLVRFIIGERIHTRALRTAWLQLAQRVCANDVLPEDIDTGSMHIHPTEAAALDRRTKQLRTLAGRMRAPFPQRLGTRIQCASIIHDPWASLDLQNAAEGLIREVTAAGGDWLATLPVLEPIDLLESPVVLLIDALAPDIWLDVLPALEPFLKNTVQTWSRLEAAPQTVPAMNALFNLDHRADPIDSFAAQDIAYNRIEGNESVALTDQMLPLVRDSAAVIRLGILDRAVHTGSMRLCDLPELLHTVLSNNLPGLIELCSREKRKLILTTDHGLTFSKKRLSHGTSGLFEQAIIRVVWDL